MVCFRLGGWVYVHMYVLVQVTNGPEPNKATSDTTAVGD